MCGRTFIEATEDVAMAIKPTNLEALIATATTNQDQQSALIATYELLRDRQLSIGTLEYIQLHTMHHYVRETVESALLDHQEVTHGILLRISEHGATDVLVLRAACLLGDSPLVSLDHLLYAGVNSRTPIARMRAQEALLRHKEFSDELRLWLIQNTEFPKIRIHAHR